MSTSPFSYDLRKRAVEFVNQGGKKTEASRIFKISVWAISSWCKRYKETGCFKEKKRPGAKPRVGKNDLLDFLKLNPNATLKEIGAHFNMTGEGARYNLKKNKISYKKKRKVMWRLTKKSDKIL